MSEEDIKEALVKFDREDIFVHKKYYGIDIDTPVEVFITIKQMSKFIKQKEKIQWYEKENKSNQEIIIKDTKEIERLHSIIKEVREYIEDNVMVYAFNDKKFPHWDFNDDNINDILEILDKENKQ